MQPHLRDLNQPSLTDTLGRILSDSRQLLHQQIELIRAETKEDVRNGLKAVLVPVTGAALLALGGVLVTVSLILLLTQAGLAPWLSCAIVALVHIAAGFTMISWARRKTLPIARSLEKETPQDKEENQDIFTQGERSQENLRWLKNHI